MMSPPERRQQYACDVTYGTNNEFGFDYLRDNMAVRAEDRVQRPHQYAIVDEVDSVLIDEARTPLIISGPVSHSLQQYAQMRPHVETLFRLQAQRITEFLNEADSLLKEYQEKNDSKARYAAGERLLQVTRGAPKHKRLAKHLADEPGLQKLIGEVEADRLREKSMTALDEELFFSIDERAHTVNISDVAQRATDRSLFRTPVLSERLDWIDRCGTVNDETRAATIEKLFDETIDRVIGTRNSAAVRDESARAKVRALLGEYVSEFGLKARSKPMTELQLEQETAQIRGRISEKIEAIIPQGQRARSADIEDDSSDILYDFAWKLNLVSMPLTLSQRSMVKESVYADYALRSERIHNIQTLLKAYALYEKDVEYVVQEGRVLIVDQFTGRLMPGRRFSDGLHQALEAKEGLKIEGETQTLATITIQNYFRMYQKLAGMTGTAETEAGEFWDIYKLDVVVIPTNQPVARYDLNDLVYKTRREKYNAVIEEIERLHKLRLPILVGTISVDVSETLSRMLSRAGIKHNVLNAKHHQKEAEIIAEAGQPGGVTIATNMAGRGTDIKLHPEIGKTTLDADGTPGGLQVIGTERHEARRIDRQLRGRSGRQGDPGASRFFISLEDNLMRLFAPERIATMMDKLGAPEGEPLEHSMINKSIERAQKRVEARNFDIRKHLLEYDNVMNQQREIIYERRNRVLEGGDPSPEVQEMIEEFVQEKAATYIPDDSAIGEVDLRPLFGELELAFLMPLKPQEFTHALESRESFCQAVLDRVRPAYKQKEDEHGVDIMREVERHVILRTIDEKWRDHLYEIDRLKEGIGWVSVGGKMPLLEYKKEAYQFFVTLNSGIRDEVVKRLFRVQVQVEVSQPLEAPAGQAQRGAEPGQILEAPEDGDRSVEDQARLDAREAQAAQLRELARRAQLARTERAISHVMGPEASGREPSAETPAASPPRPASGVLLGAGGGGLAAPKAAATVEKVGRNDPCPCGSGKKYKKCHGA
jgi:preprotein translocase subunit SecA